MTIQIHVYPVHADQIRIAMFTNHSQYAHV